MEAELELFRFRLQKEEVTDRKGERVIIREYDHESDFEKLVQMYETFSPENRCLGLPPSTRKAIEAWVSFLAKRGYNIVAEKDGKIIGHAAVIPTEDGKKVDLTLFVHQDYHDRGIGQELLKRIIEICRKNDFEGIMLVTERTNRRAIHVYKKYGFKVVNPEFEYDMYLKLK